MSMILGIDFDNTIISYDSAFYRVALEKGLIPASITAKKESVRDYLRSIDKEDSWTELQGYVYGARMDEVTIFPGVVDCIRGIRSKDIPLFIVSHKTKYPYLGQRFDLHLAVQNWLHNSKFLEVTGMKESEVFLELTKKDKIQRIISLKCTHFIDDLAEVFTDPDFPANTQKILFSSGFTQSTKDGIKRFVSWHEINEYLLQE